jgi:hypothetical protein
MNKNKEKKINKIGKKLFETVLERVLKEMSKEDLEEYLEFMERDVKPSELLKYLSRKVPNFSKILAEEAGKFKKETKEILEA